MNRFTQTSSVEFGGSAKDPDIIYYNASIVNNTTDDVNGASGANIIDPPIKFNETRDTAIVSDASQYQFSIVRFVVNGGNLDLPLFIPAIQSGTGQDNPNLTEYGCAITFSDSTGTNNLVSANGLRYVEWIPEYKNGAIAPYPRTTANAKYAGVWNSTRTYFPNQIVYYAPDLTYYQANQPAVPAPNLNVVPPTNPAFWTATSPELGQPQDLSSRYYWCSTYSYFAGLIQNAFALANSDCYEAWKAKNGAVAPYPTSDAWFAAFPTPVISFNPGDNLFSITYPPSYLSTQQQIDYGYTPAEPNRPVLSLYLNTNLYGLLANFNATYYNTPNPIYVAAPGGVAFVQDRWAYPSVGTETPFPDGYAYELQVEVGPGGKNIIHPLTLAATPVESLGLVVMTQDYLSTSTLWSPIDSLVFISSLLPIQNEATAPPNSLGTKNIGNSAATSQSAFQPIITDVALSLSGDPSGYRKQLYYAPTAEYRMADFQNSKADIRNIDVAVFWRSRLDNNLYPVSMFNLSSVSIKLMFRKKSVLAKSERMGMF
jgi:hypothetical protein